MSANERGAARMSPLRNARGFTLVELIVVLVIAAIALPGLMIYFTESMRHSSDAQVETIALGLAQELMEEVKAKRWDENSPIDPDNPLYSDPLAPEGEMRCDPAAIGCTAFDDIDDYNGLNNDEPRNPHGAPVDQDLDGVNDFAGYRQLVTVCYANPVPPVSDGGAGTDAGVCAAGPTSYKKITVTVQWGDGQQIQLESVMADYQI